MSHADQQTFMRGFKLRKAGALAAATLVTAEILWTGSATAADPVPPRASAAVPAPNDPSGWQFYSAAYLWMTSVKGDARVLPPLPTTKIDMSFTDALKDIEGGLIGTGFARYDRFLVMGDIVAARTTPSQTVSALGVTGTLATVSKSVTALGAVGYRLVDGQNWIVDGYVGARVWWMENTLSLSSPGLLNGEVNRSESWVDGVVGGQVRYNFDNGFYVNALGFVGAGGAKAEGDIYGGVGYRFSGGYEAYLGYRALSVNYENGPFLYKVTQHGPIIGLGFKF